MIEKIIFEILGHILHTKKGRGLANLLKLATSKIPILMRSMTSMTKIKIAVLFGRILEFKYKKYRFLALSPPRRATRSIFCTEKHGKQ